MCIGIPMQVVEVGAGHARCRSGAEILSIDTSLVGDVAPGTWLMTFLGAAREVMSPEAARRSLAALSALEAVMQGRPADLDAAFADLIGREPQLPGHLLPAHLHPTPEPEA
ncbi:HypC/HybG/HupF family hydrogenase formation chaperone [Nitrospirillum viridazoti]|uniref:Hydrogenase n=1 Tax=Nitrospirillum viridazoti CBAmc TaxID=1441467 RepID=A0A248JUF9_9PROT|nr:HypC/HybG/HupF family hydrogenase formation chaperone [Nitrospirillum amazonense]ASG22362.1 hydrogenase [Nitrospirillum amazonense CBAmc]TWB43107.1 hydrogenase expression/formation protein HypC [Nitrospirillum amazonense]